MTTWEELKRKMYAGRPEDLASIERLADRDAIEFLASEVERLQSSQREQTAATILAALLPIAVAANAGLSDDPKLIGRAVALADALRAELGRKP